MNVSNTGVKIGFTSCILENCNILLKRQNIKVRLSYREIQKIIWERLLIDLFIRSEN